MDKYWNTQERLGDALGDLDEGEELAPEDIDPNTSDDLS